MNIGEMWTFWIIKELAEAASGIAIGIGMLVIIIICIAIAEKVQKK